MRKTGSPTAVSWPACSAEMTAAPAAWAVWGDVLWSLGLGCLLGFGRDAAGFLLGEGPLRRFCLDLLAFAAAAVLVYGFSAGVSSSGVTRWYMPAAMAAGAVAWYAAMRPGLHRLLSGLGRGMLWPVRTFRQKVWRPLLQACTAGLRRFLPDREKKKDRKQRKNGKKQLQKPSKILYN